MSEELRQPLVESLNERELEVLSKLAEGKTNREIGVELMLSLNTIKWYARQIYDKLGVNNREDAARRALVLGLLPGQEGGDLPPHNLPAQLTPFVGRQEELAELERLLADPATRLITIVGPGGMGKTRLALQATRQQLHRDAQPIADGITFVSLAELEEPQDVSELLIQVLGLAPSRADRRPTERLTRYLRERRMLLLLDNVEHLAGQELSAFLTELLTAAPDLTVLATSRRRLNVRGEQLLWVQGLELRAEGVNAMPPELGHVLETNSAVALFVQTARRAHPSFSLTEENTRSIVEVCRLVEGMPLGIELAAAWMGVLTPDELLKELSYSPDILATEAGNVSANQRSLRLVFDTSWTLLQDSERSTLRCLSLFRGGFTREAAQAVCDVPLPMLLALVNKCWLKRGESGRFSIHEVLRQYAAEALASEPEREAANRENFSAYYCRWLAAKTEDIVGPQQQETLAAVEPELANIRIACLAAIETNQVGPLAEAVHALGQFYRWQGRYLAGDRFLEALLQELGHDLQADRSVQITRLRLLVWRMTLHSLLGRRRRSEALALDAEALSNRLEDAGKQVPLDRLYIARERGYNRLFSLRPPQEAVRYFSEALELAQRIDSPNEEGQTLLGLARARRNLRQFHEAQIAVVKATELFQASGHQVAVADAVALRGNILVSLERPQEALDLLQDGPHLALSHADIEAYHMANLGRAHYFLGHFQEAATAVLESIKIYREHEIGTGLLWSGLLSIIYLHQGRYDAALKAAKQRSSVPQTPNRVEGQALEAGTRGARAIALGKWEEAGEHLRRSLATRTPTPDWRLPLPYALLALVSRKVGDDSEAREHLSAELEVTLTSRFHLPMLLSLPVAALLLADRGNVARAAEIYFRVWQEPFAQNSVWLRDVAGRELEGITSRLTKEDRSTARERGAGLDLWTTVEALLEEFG